MDGFDPPHTFTAGSMVSLVGVIAILVAAAFLDSHAIWGLIQ